MELSIFMDAFTRWRSVSLWMHSLDGAAYLDSLTAMFTREDKTSQETEEDKDVLVRRQKQIDYGRQLGAYRKYLRAVPR